MSYVTLRMKDALKDHVLEEVPAGGEFRAFYMKEPGQCRMMSTLFIFGPEGIVIMGDLCPGGPKNQGSISDFNYGIGWFSGKLSEHYLCEKFLTREWQVEVAEGWCREHIEDIKKEADPDDLKKLPEWEELLSQLEGGEMGRDHFHDDLQDLDYAEEDEGFDYPLQTAGWLCSLQQRFAELISVKEEDRKLNSRELAEKIWNEAVRPCYEGMAIDTAPEPEDREASIQGIEGLLERHAGMKPDPILEKAREESAE